MKRTVAVIGMLLAAGLAPAQDRIPPEDAQKYAKLMVAEAAKVPHLQVRLEANADKPFGLKKDDVGVMIVPARQLSEEAIRKTNKEITPLGQLWFRGLTVIAKDQAVANERLRLVTINIEGQDHSLPFFLLGVRKKGEDTLELVVYAKDKEPLLAVPLTKTAETKQEFPIELEGKGENDRGVLTLKILGKYQAQLTLTKQE